MIVYKVILLERIIRTTDDAITICEGIVVVDFNIPLVKGVITVKVTDNQSQVTLNLEL